MGLPARTVTGVLHHCGYGVTKAPTIVNAKREPPGIKKSESGIQVSDPSRPLRDLFTSLAEGLAMP